MKRSLCGFALALAAAALATGSVHAVVYDGNLSTQFVGVEPSAPIAGVPFRVNVLAGPCEALSVDPFSATIVSQDNDVVSIRIPGVPDLSCQYEFRHQHYVVPGLAAGTYRIDLVFYFIEQPGDFGEPAGYIGGRDITVLAARPATRVPALSIAAIALLGMAIAGAGLLLRKAAS